MIQNFGQAETVVLMAAGDDDEITAIAIVDLPHRVVKRQAEDLLCRGEALPDVYKRQTHHRAAHGGLFPRHL